MCRRNHLYGCCLICFGAGLFFGLHIVSGLLFTFLGIGLIALGVLLLKRK